MKALMLLLLVPVLSACSSFHQTPHIAYAGAIPLAQTAIFASWDARTATTNDSRVAAVDNRELSGFTEGNPYWVRVLPGKHVFRIRYTTNHQMTRNGPTYAWAILDLEVDNMQPRHVYVARYSENEGKVRVTAEDLGEAPDFSIAPDNQPYKAGF